MNRAVQLLLIIMFLPFSFGMSVSGATDASASTIAGAEYFLGTDPGEGNGTPMAATDGVFNQPLEDISLDVDTSTMTSGLHTLWVRARNSDGHWGTPRPYTFEVVPPPVMVAAEYYIDTDPGAGNGTPIANLSGSLSAIQENLNTGNLSIGFHTLYLRGKDSYLRWGEPQSFSFLNGYELSVGINGTGTGTVTSTDPAEGIACGSDCTEIYDNNQSVTLTPTAAPGSTFMGWTGCTPGAGNSCTVLLSGDMAVTATFDDITPPETTINSKPASLTNNPVAPFTFSSSEVNSTFACSLDNGDFTSCISPKSYPGLTGTGHSFRVQAIDAAGNVDASPATYSWAIDLVPPVVTITGKPATASKNRSPSFTFSSEPDASFECRLNNGSFTPCTSPKDYTALADGSYTFYIRAKDLAGNQATVSTQFIIDNAPPTVSAFTLPAFSASLTVSVSTFTALDVTSGVAGYLITNTATVPAPDAIGWSAMAPGFYPTTGSTTLYAWAKDAAGNVSTQVKSASVVIDTAPPTVTTFTLPTISASLSVNITTFVASDPPGGSGIAGYMITETTTPPLANGTGWNATAPVSLIFTTPGSKTLYAWTKDQVGNVSTQLKSATINMDLAPPTVTVFDVPAIVTTLTVPITTLAASDNSGGSGVAAYLVTQTATTPLASDIGWSSNKPASSIFSTAGSKTLYAWVRDAAGNISSAKSVIVIIDIPDAFLYVQLAGSGNGSVNSVPSGLSCISGTCSHGFTYGTAVDLLPAAGSDSVFIGWAGQCTAAGNGTCKVIMNNNKSATATFSLTAPARIDGALPEYFQTVQAAYGSLKGDGTIQLREGNLSGSLTAAIPGLEVALKGGYNAAYLTADSTTILQGKLLLRAGTVRVERFGLR